MASDFDVAREQSNDIYYRIKTRNEALSKNVQWIDDIYDVHNAPTTNYWNFKQIARD